MPKFYPIISRSSRKIEKRYESIPFSENLIAGAIEEKIYRGAKRTKTER